MRIKWLLSILSVAVGVPILTLVVAPQLGTTVQVDSTQEVRKPAGKMAGVQLTAPITGGTRISPTRRTRAGSRNGSSKGGLQTNGPGALAVVINGQTIAATPANGNIVRSGVWHNLSIFVSATQQEELFILGIPHTPTTVDSPLLVGMRQSNVSHGDIIEHTTFWDECMARGWYLLAPLSRGEFPYDTNGGSTLNAQENTKAALAWVIANHSIDGDRIYGVGFSAGAGLLASYASRHLDPAEPMFAAVAYHTGFSDLVDIYNSTSGGLPAVEAQLGGTPFTKLFEYRQISTLELDASRLWLSGGDHGAWNLGSIPTQIWYATNDTNTGLVLQTTQLFDWMSLNGNGPVSLITGVSQDPTAGFHNWEVLDEAQICNWFALQTLTQPDSGDLLIDRDATYHDYAVQQDAAGSFSRLSFDKDTVNNTLSLTQTQNVQRIMLSPNNIGLSTVPGGPTLFLNLDAQDSGDEIVLEGVLAAPSVVKRNGVPQLSNITWAYSGTQDTLTIIEPQTGMRGWEIEF